MTPQEAIQKLRSLPEEQQRAVLARLSPDERGGILKQLSVPTEVPGQEAPPLRQTPPELQKVFSPLTAAKEFGKGFVHTIPTMLAHPVQTAASMGQPFTASGVSPEGYPGVMPVATGTAPGNAQVSAEAEQGQAQAAKSIADNPAYAAGGLASQVAAGKLLGATAGSVAPGLRSAGGLINDALIGAPSDETVLHGATPGLQMAKEGIVGASPTRLASLLRERIPEATVEHRSVVAAAPQGTTINTGPMIAEPFRGAISEGVHPVTGAASPAQIRTAGATLRQLTHVPDETTGAPTPLMRNPSMSPLEATNLKSNIYERTNYDPSGKYNIANTGLKGAAHNLKVAVEQAVPESVPSGQRLHNLMSAKNIVEPQSRGFSLPTSKSGLLDQAALGAGTRLATHLYQAGDLAGQLANVPTSLRMAYPAIAAFQTQKDNQ